MKQDHVESALRWGQVRQFRSEAGARTQREEYEDAAHIHADGPSLAPAGGEVATKLCIGSGARGATAERVGLCVEGT